MRAGMWEAPRGPASSAGRQHGDAGLDGLRASTTGSHMAAAHLATLTPGTAGRRLLSALIVVSCLGGCMNSLLTGSRVFVPLATDGLFVRWLRDRARGCSCRMVVEAMA